MRAALRLLASVSRSTQYLEPGAPTGLTGLLTHATPRSTLLYLYSTTLESLQHLPEHSVYRQATEALTKQRMRIVEKTKPEGLAEWQERVAPLVDKHPDAFRRVPAMEGGGFNIVYHEPPPEEHWISEDDQVNAPYRRQPNLEGIRSPSEIAGRKEEMERDLVAEEEAKLRIEAEPPLTIEQVGQVEKEIGAGLIEEVIAVARGEKGLVETLRESKV